MEMEFSGVNYNPWNNEFNIDSDIIREFQKKEHKHLKKKKQIIIIISLLGSENALIYLF